MERRKLDSLRYIAEPFAQTANRSQSSKICESTQVLYSNGPDVKSEWGGYSVRPIVCSVWVEVNRNHARSYCLGRLKYLPSASFKTISHPSLPSLAIALAKASFSSPFFPNSGTNSTVSSFTPPTWK